MLHSIASISVGVGLIISMHANGLPHYIRCAHHHFLQRVNSSLFYELAFFLIAYYYTCLITTKFFDVLNNRVIITMNLRIDTCTCGIQDIVRRY